jgi:hypothetical protein
MANTRRPRCRSQTSGHHQTSPEPSGKEAVDSGNSNTSNDDAHSGE